MTTYQQPLQTLAKAFAAVQSEEEAAAFLQDLCTPQELEDFCLRWSIVNELNQGFTYREIHARTKASLTTIGRIAKAIKYGSGGYQSVYEDLHLSNIMHDKEHL